MAKREYIQANKEWLEAKAKEEGVKALSKGIYYKVLSEGNSSPSTATTASRLVWVSGSKPSRNSAHLLAALAFFANSNSDRGR